MRKINFVLFLGGLVTLIFVLSSCMNIPAFVPSNMIYVATQEGINVIDGQANTVVANIPINMNFGFMAVNPNTNLIYVSSPASNTITVISATTTQILTTIAVDGVTQLAVNPNTNLIYCIDNEGVSVISGISNTVTYTINFSNGQYRFMSSGLYAIGINPTTNKIYVCSHSYPYSIVNIIDGNTNNVIGNVRINDSYIPKLVVNPTTNEIYALVPDIYSYGAIIIIGGQTNTVVGNINFEFDSPVDIGVNPNTNLVYITRASGILSVVDGSTNQLITTVTATQGLTGSIGVNPTTDMIYVSNSNFYENTVDVINGQTNTVIKTIPVGEEPGEIGILY
ncbi:MAG: YncE family protein [Thermotogae bacterium]|nr:YncE family protein [Thermotogota bacterium]